MSIKLKDTILDYIDKAYKDSSGNTISSTYLPLSGGTIGTNSSNRTNLVINSNDGTETAIQVSNNNVVKSVFGWWNGTGSYGTYIYSVASQKYLGIKDDGTPHYHGNTLIHSNNYTDYTYSKSTIDTKLGGYLPLSGGTITGNNLWIGASNNYQSVKTLIFNNTSETANYGTNIRHYYNNEYKGLLISPTSGLYYSDNGTTYPLIHSGNIGNQSVAYATETAKIKTTQTSWNDYFQIPLSDSVDNGYKALYIDSNSGIAYNPYTDTLKIVNAYITNNVGIGTTSPQYKLDVSGTVRASGSIETGGYLTFGSYGARFTSDVRSSWRTSIYGDTVNSSRLRPVRTDVTIADFSEIYGSGLTWATGDTHGYLSVSYGSGKAWIGGGDSDRLNWSTYLVTGKNIGSQSVNYANSAGSATSATSASYSRNLLGRNTSGSDYGATAGNLVFAEWNTHGDNRWYLKAEGYETRVGYANNAGSVAWSNVSGKPSTFSPSSHTHSYAGSSSAGGAATSANKLNRIDNTVNSTSSDTTSSWGSLGTSVHFYATTGQLKDQPNQYGLILNVTGAPGAATEVHQLWMTQASGNLAHRGGNSAGWSGTWRTILDSSNWSSYCAAASHTHSNYSLTSHTHDYAASSHTHNYAGSSSSGGAANNSLKWGGYSIVVGSTGTDANTIYIIV